MVRATHTALLCVLLGITGPAACGTGDTRVRAQAAPPATQQPPLARAGQNETCLGVRDRGIFSDLDPQLQLALPTQLDPSRLRFALDRGRSQLVLYDRDWPLKVYPLERDTTADVEAIQSALRPYDRQELAPLLSQRHIYAFDTPVELPPGDADGDGIPDPLDVLLGARKAALNADRYDGHYERIAYPGGDVPRTFGVCTDVVVRAYRNAGYDLQQLVHDDLLRARAAYPSVRRPDPNVDHRRVKSLLPYFVRHMQAHAPQLTAASDPLRPGDVVFMDTFPSRPGVEHVGILADSQHVSGLPFVINNWTDGTVTRPMELLSWVPVGYRFRIPERLPDHGPIAALKTQLITVVADDWSSTRAKLRRYERAPGKGWRPVAAALPVVLGRSGYGWGDGLHGQGAPAGHAGPTKREGDGRSPAGVFELGTAYGYALETPAPAVSYARSTAALRCIDDADSRHYNRIVSSEQVTVDWRSAERMRRDDDLYELAIEIEHNQNPTSRGHGSCIFLHVWAGPDVPVTGCTALDKTALRELLQWLRPNAALLVALPQREYASLQRAWGLP